MKRVVIIGAGQSGLNVARNLRIFGAPVSIVLMGEEEHPPYERPPLSKEILSGAKPPESAYLTSVSELDAAGIEFKPNCRVVAVDRHGRKVITDCGLTVKYDILVFATGSRVRKLKIPGASLSGIHYLRTLTSSIDIKRTVKPGAAILVVGGGWIGLEVAATLRRSGAAVHLIESSSQLCGRSVPITISDYLVDFHKRHGVEIRLNESVVSFSGEEYVQSALLSSGERLDVSAAVVGIGIDPNVDLAIDAGIETDNGIVVDERGRTRDPAIFAVGDVTNHPNRLIGRRLRLETWANAQNQAKIVAQTIAGQVAHYSELPWFWSDQFDLNIQVLGDPRDCEKMVMRGSMAENKFLQIFLSGSKVRAAVSVNQGRDIRIMRQLIEARADVHAEELANPSVSLQTIVDRRCSYQNSK